MGALVSAERNGAVQSRLLSRCDGSGRSVLGQMVHRCRIPGTKEANIPEHTQMETYLWQHWWWNCVHIQPRAGDHSTTQDSLPPCTSAPIRGPDKPTPPARSSKDENQRKVSLWHLQLCERLSKLWRWTGVLDPRWCRKGLHGGGKHVQPRDVSLAVWSLERGMKSTDFKNCLQRWVWQSYLEKSNAMWDQGWVGTGSQWRRPAGCWW